MYTLTCLTHPNVRKGKINHISLSIRSGATEKAERVEVPDLCLLHHIHLLSLVLSPN